MQSIRELGTNQMNPPSIISLRGLGGIVGLTPAFSVMEMIRRLKQPVTFSAQVLTPSGTALGGTVDVSLFSDGA